MGPERLSSEIGKMIARIARGHKLPSEWTAGDFVALINGYKGLTEVLRSEHPTAKEQTIDDIYRNGIPGSYEAMVKRLEQREKAIKRDHTTKERGKKPRRRPELDTDTEE